MHKITCAKCRHEWDYEWPGSWDKAICPQCGENVRDSFHCRLCDGYVRIFSDYGSAQCLNCGVDYEYDEGQMLSPTKEQARLWNASAKLLKASEALAEYVETGPTPEPALSKVWEVAKEALLVKACKIAKEAIAEVKG